MKFKKLKNYFSRLIASMELFSVEANTEFLTRRHFVDFAIYQKGRKILREWWLLFGIYIVFPIEFFI